MIDPDNLPDQPELLVKVLQPGEPLALSNRARCKLCGMVWPNGEAPCECIIGADEWCPSVEKKP